MTGVLIRRGTRPQTQERPREDKVRMAVCKPKPANTLFLDSASGTVRKYISVARATPFAVFVTLAPDNRHSCGDKEDGEDGGDDGVGGRERTRRRQTLRGRPEIS